MSNDEAKFILSAYRPGGEDAGDPAMAKALEQATHDPALRAWFERGQKHDLAVAGKLKEVMPPAGLRDAILAGGRVSAGSRESTDEHMAGAERKKRSWWAQPVWLAAAAAVALFLGVGVWRMTPVQGGNMEEFAMKFVGKGFMLQKHSADVAALKTWLSEKHGPLPEALPAKFADLKALGCRTLDYQGHEVSLVCFERGGKEFHVFVARLDDVPGAMEAMPRFVEGQKLVAATWTDSKNRYVLVSDAGMEAVKRLL